MKTVFFMLIAFAGLYVGYRLNHGFEIYYKKQIRQIDKYGKLISYMYRHYRVVNKIWKKGKNRNREWLYIKCYNYTKKCEKCDINNAKAYLKSDLKIQEAVSLLITVCVGLSTPIINSYAYNIALYIKGINTTVDLSYDELIAFNELITCLQNTIGIMYIFFMVCYVVKLTIILKKQQYLLSVLEDIDK